MSGIAESQKLEAGSWKELGGALRDDLAALEERLDAATRYAVLADDRLGRVLDQVDAAGAVGAVGAAAVEGDAREDGDRAGGADDRHARIVALVADEVVALGIVAVRADGLAAGA